MTWTILDNTIIGKRKHYLVKCHCGYVGTRRASWVNSYRTTECKVCSAKRTAKKYGLPSAFKGVGGLGKTQYSAIKYGAERRDIPFDVSITFLWELFLKQEGKCALTGLPLILVPAIKKNNVNWDVVTASVDRINSSLGYTETNTQWVHKEINRFKNNYSVETFVQMCSLVVRHVNPDLSTLNDILVSVKEQRLGGEESTNNPPTSAQHPEMDDDIV